MTKKTNLYRVVDETRQIFLDTNWARVTQLFKDTFYIYDVVVKPLRSQGIHNAI